MSHFTVLVVGDDVDEQLAPYKEEADVSHREYLSAKSRRAMAKEYSVRSHNDLPALLPHVDDWTGYEGGIDDKGLYCLSFRNGDAKWDWYTVGGRWRGFFKLKDGAEGCLGPEPDAFLRGATWSLRWSRSLPAVIADLLFSAVDILKNRMEALRRAVRRCGAKLGVAIRRLRRSDVPETRKNAPALVRADSARKAAIDFEGMRADAEEQARATWHAYTDAITGTPESTPWAIFEAKIAAGAMTAERARNAYHAQERVVAFRQAMEPLLGPFISLEDFPATEEDYIAEKRREAVLPFAYLVDGEWHERAEMGWWGMARNERDAAAWAEDVETMLAALPDDTLLTIVDCHI